MFTTTNMAEHYVCITFQIYMPTILIVMCSWLIFWLKLDTADQVICTIWIVSKSLKKGKSNTQSYHFLSGITGSIANVNYGHNKWSNTRSFTTGVLRKGTNLVIHSWHTVKDTSIVSFIVLSVFRLLTSGCSAAYSLLLVRFLKEL